MALANQQLAIRQNNALLPAQQDLQTVTQLAKIAAQSGLAKVSDEVKASFIILKGLELGIPPFTALGGVFITETWNAKANRNESTIGLTVSLMLGLVQGSGLVEDIIIPDPGAIDGSATVTVKRKNQSPFSFTFTREMSIKMGLAGKYNWKNMESVMIVNRAISGALRPIFADVLQGLYLVEEINPDVEVSEDSAPIQVIAPAAPQLPSTSEPPANITTLPTQQTNQKSRPAWVTNRNIDTIFEYLHGQSLSDADIFRLTGMTPETKYGEWWDAYETGKAAKEAILKAQADEMSNPPIEPDPIEPERPPGWEDIREIFPNDVVPTADNKKARKEKAASKTMEERIKEGGWVKAILRSVEVKEYTNKANEPQLRLQFNAELENGQVVKAGMFDTNLLIETKWMIETEMVKGQVVAFYDQLDALVKQDGKFWNVMEESIHRNPSAKFEDAFDNGAGIPEEAPVSNIPF